MSDTTADLQALARHCGIADGYEDIWDRHHETDDATRRALLAAMHLPIGTVEPGAILRGLQDAHWQKPLPPVLVVRAGEPSRIELSLPVEFAERVWRWTLRLENGEARRGELVPAHLSPLGQRRLAGADFWGRDEEAAEADFSRHLMLLPALTLTGYHRVEIDTPDGRQDAMALIVVPSGCYQPESIRHGGKVWGPAVQLYGLRSRRNWGVGDFTDLRALVDIAADAGGGIVGTNPLHALFPDNPAHISPYSPSSRAALNLVYLDVEAMPEFAGCAAAQSLVAGAAFQARLRSLRAGELVDYPAVWAAKREVLELLWQHFRDHELMQDTAQAGAFRDFRLSGGTPLERLARYEALQAHFRAQDAGLWGWPVWPEDYRDPDGEAVAAFVAQHPEAVAFHAWLQWRADTQLAEVGRQSWRRGLGVGLYADLAVGVNPGGADAWGWQGTFARGAYAGCPPDEFNALGQDWGLPPFVPHRLREAAYAPFIEMLRANMKHAGALRIDHAMGLTRLFWVAADAANATDVTGATGATGAYVAYPLDDLLGIVALESRRNHCLVIGEALGTVPAGFHARLAGADFLAYCPFPLERAADGDFRKPGDYERKALVSASTHDLPTLAGLWQGLDIDRRTEMDLFPNDELRERVIVERAQDRARLLVALEREGLLPAGTGIHPVAVPALTPELVAAIHAWLARTPCQVMALQPEDVLGQVEQANLPGSPDDRHPNWRRRLALDLEDWREDARFLAVFETLRRERGSAVLPHAVEYGAPVAPRVAVIPRATYRLQFNAHFTFDDATAIVPYLAALGVSHVYASPYLKARPGSSHGYDIVDHAALNPEIGSEEDYARFVTALQAHGMGQILDIVPNHMGVMGADNAWWLDVLENGPAAVHGSYFDIDWAPLNPELKGKVLLPLLGDHYGSVLKRGELQLRFDAVAGEFSLFYWQHRLPIDPASYPQIVGLRFERLAAVLGDGNPVLAELQSLLTAFERLPGRLDDDPLRIGERQRDKEVHKRHLATLCAASPDLSHHIDDALAELNGRPGDPASFDALHELIRHQGYRLAFWRVASDEINYRRFFDINDLAALRMEDAAVFEATHSHVLERVRMGQIDGLRIDHPDGLYDPGQYFARLQEAASGRPLAAAGAGEPLPLYLVVEKILAEHEPLPAEWPIHGATGYRFANLANNLFVDPAAGRRMTRVYADFIGENIDFDALVYRTKKLIMETALASELAVLSNRLARIAALDRDTCDYTLNSLKDALAEIVACFPVYRSYVGPAGLSETDRRHIEWAVAVATRKSPAADASVFDFVKGVLTTDIAQGRSEDYRAAVLGFAMRFQQFSSPVMAKGVEDTAFYRYHRLASLNDVGGEPKRFGISVAAYHAVTRERARHHPHNLLATSTHDSKRSEDVRCRIDVLSELPAVWKLMLRRWARINRTKKREIDGRPCPTANDEYLIYQTLLGSWPLVVDVDLDAYRARIVDYLTKAVREAKEHSSWVNASTDYEAALADFIGALLAPGEKNLFLADFVPFARQIAHHGLLNSLSLALLKLTAPGVPDIYQGCELWQFNLVDPDNRRPVDYALRRQLLDTLDGFDPASPLDDPRHKLALVRHALALRTRQPDLFETGDYLPLAVRGERAVNACAYARCRGDDAIVVIVPRLTFRLAAGELPLGAAVWGDTAVDLPKALRGRRWRNVLTGEALPAGASLPLATAFARAPVVLLQAE